MTICACGHDDDRHTFALGCVADNGSCDCLEPPKDIERPVDPAAQWADDGGQSLN
jgi:hypothetical protein